MTDKLTAAGIKVPWPLTMYRRLTYMDASPELRLKWASKAIDALVDRLVQTTNELRLSNHMHAELTDKHTEALMRAEAAEAANERLKSELGREGKIELKAVAEQLRGGVGSTSPCRHILCNHINGRTVCFACGAMWRDGRRYYEEDEEVGDA